MTPQRTRSIIKAIFEKYSPSTVREGSIISDHIVNPVSLLGAPIYDQVDRLVQENSYPQDGDSGDILDRKGERLYAPRVLGTRCRAAIRIAVKDRKDFTVRAGSAVFSSEGVAYRIVTERRFSGASLSEIQKWGRTVYVTSEIPVEAAVVGPDSFVGPEALSSVGFSVPGLIGVYNELQSTSGTRRESNFEFGERLKKAIASRSLDTPNGIEFNIPAQFGDAVQQVSIHGSDDPIMKRDVVKTRRITTHGAVDISVTLDRSAGNTNNVDVDVNGDTATIATATADYQVIGYDSLDKSFTTLNTGSATTALGRLRDTPYGDYVILVVQKGTTPSQDLKDEMEASLSSIMTDSLPDANRDLILIGRKGDPSFITREYFSDPALGQDTVSLNTLILQQTGGSISAGFQNKTRGTSVPNASRFLTRSSLEKEAAPNIFSKEIAQDQYNLLSRPDFRSVSIGTDILFEDDFIRLDDLQQEIELATALGNGWVAGNTGEPKRRRDSSAGVYLYKGMLVLGPTTVDAADIIEEGDSSIIRSPIAFNFPRNATSVDRTRFTPPLRDSYLDQLDDDLSLLNVSPADRLRIMWQVYDMILDTESRGNGQGYKGAEGATSPVVQRALEDPFGFAMTGTMRTTDNGEGSCAFTMARNQPGEGEMFRWYEGYGISVSVKTQDGLPNVFVIDNASTDREMVVIGDELVNGKMDHNVLAQTVADVKPNIDYNFEVVFGSPSSTDPEDAVTIDFRLWKVGDQRPSTPTITYGAYVPAARRIERLSTTFETGSDINTTTAQNVQSNHVGIGVSNTAGGGIWVIDDFKLRNVDSDYAQAVVELDVRGASSTLDLQVIARGQGYEGGSKKYGHEVHIWNPSTSTYTLLGDHTYSGYYFNSGRYQVDIAPYENRGTLTLLVTSKYPHQGVASAATSSILDIDFVYGEDYRSEDRVGGKADVLFVQKPADGSGFRPSSSSSQRIASAQEVNYLYPAGFGGPVEDIERVFVDSQTPVDLTPDEYRLFWDEDALRGSMQEKLVLLLDPTLVGLPIVVQVRAHNQVSAVQQYFDTANVKKVDGDLLARHRKSQFIDIDATVSGDWSAEDQSALQEYIFTASSVSYSDILAFLFNAGATDVILEGPNALSVTHRYLSSDGDWINTPVSSEVAVQPDEAFVPGEITITVV
jgi:hypothetical protein